MSAIKIIIVGAGIGGPAAAIGLARNGHDVTIYERARSMGEVGYAFRITPNSDRCLKYLGIDCQVGGAVSSNVVLLMDAEGKILETARENETSEKSKTGTSVFAYRPQLHEQLMKAAQEAGVHLKSGVPVNSVDVARTAIVLDDGTTVTADLIIAADGVHSVVRPYVVDSAQHFPSASTGHNAFRFMIPRSQVQNDSTLSSVFSDDARMVTWAGPGKRILVYPVDFNRQFNITCTHPQHLSDKDLAGKDIEAAIAYNQKVSSDTALDIYREFGAVATHLLEMADPEGFRVWKLLDMDEIPTWSREHVVLLGDACHPVSPFGFSGHQWQSKMQLPSPFFSVPTCK